MNVRLTLSVNRTRREDGVNLIFMSQCAMHAAVILLSVCLSAVYKLVQASLDKRQQGYWLHCASHVM